MPCRALLSVAFSALLAVAAGCYGTNAERCGDGYCPAGTVCLTGASAAPGTCAWAAAECADGHEEETCLFAPGEAGVCMGRQCVPATCGDGARRPPEECDEGTANDDLLPDACRRDCRAAWCGDGINDTGEERGCFGDAEPFVPGPLADVVPGDFDGDGERDLVAIGPAGTHARIYRREGGALAATPIDVPFDDAVPGGDGLPLERGLACDLDGDGDDELVMISTTTMTAFELAGDTLTALAPFEADFTFAHSECVDLDGDGAASIMNVQRGGHDLRTIDRVEGGLAASLKHSSSGIDTFTVAAFDGDGTLATITSEKSFGDSILVVDRGPDGASNGFVTGVLPNRAVRVLDIDGDGANELVYLTELGELYVLVVNSEKRYLGGYHDGEGRLEVVDLDADGRDDLALHGYWAGLVYGGDGSSQVMNADAALESARVLDVDGDDVADLVALGAVPSLRRGGDGPFGRPRQVAPSGALVSAIDLGDDPLPDALVSAGHDVLLRRGAPGGLGAPVYLTTTAHQPTTLLAADLDGDGDREPIAVANPTLGGGHEVHVLRNDGGLFLPEPPVLIDGSATLLAGDLIGDGADDVVRCNDGVVEVALDATLATWATLVHPELGCERIAVVDVDGGRPELLVLSAELVLFSLNAEGRLEVPTLWTLDRSSNVTDVNVMTAGDGKRWVVAVLSNGAVHARRMSGLVPEKNGLVVPGLYPGARSPVLADVDRDGHDDIVFLRSVGTGAEILVSFGHGGAMLAPQTVGRVQGFGGLSTADLGGDGRLDLLVSSARATWWRAR
jgi:hypothetical protein